jgi:hypothetical protein
MFKRLLLMVVVPVVLYHAWGQAKTPDIALAASDIPAFEFSPQLSIAEDPIQEAVRGVPAIRVEEYTVTPVAAFQVAGRVLGARHYSADREADLSPVDLAMGWGPMANNTVLRAIDISQGGRFYRWYTEKFPIPRQAITQHSANMHLVPASREVARRIAEVESGQEIRFKGYLLQVQADDGWRWRSSMTREDQGAGACEVVLVDAIETL